VIATGILGADNAAPFASLFAAKGIVDGFLRIPGKTRINIKLSHDGDTTDINLPGLAVSAERAAAVAERTEALAKPGTLVLLAGSLPEGVGDDFYASLTARLVAHGLRVLLDTSGVPLTAALAGAVLPYVVKPNRAELEEFAGTSLMSDAALLGAARGLIAAGVTLAVVSLGTEGALFVTQDVALRAGLPAIETTSTVGAGDAMVAGIIAGLREEAGLERLACLATAFAVGKLTRAGPNLPAREEVEALAALVQVQIL
jgi:1-phosphofructokinase